MPSLLLAMIGGAAGAAFFALESVLGSLFLSGWWAARAVS
jgi:hypothetical protein